ncbi:hypothetical protein, partial [Pseudomonas viridiflava]|uniref:hypothetical protein n=1 Tax=Pseudomonas viridiflava TaxID=33069 RepID=UPI00197DEBF4
AGAVRLANDTGKTQAFARSASDSFDFYSANDRRTAAGLSSQPLTSTARRTAPQPTPSRFVKPGNVMK